MGGIQSAITCLALHLTLTSILVADDEDSRFIAGLRERRLFSLAETYCQQRLSAGQPSEVDRVELTVELVRTYAEHALHARGEVRESLWQQAHAVAAPFRESSEPRTVLVRVQDALTQLARGELLRMESEIAAPADTALEAARSTLREAASSLAAIDRKLSEAIPIQRRNPLRPEALSAEELASLQNHVRYHLARTYKNQALCFPANSSDRTASLTAALEQLDQPLVQLAPGTPLYVDVRLERVVCLRLLGDTAGAAGDLKTLLDETLSPGEQLQVRAERIRWHLARNEPKEALDVVAEGRTIAETTAPELDFAWLETYLGLWKSAADRREQAEANRWRDKSVATARFIEQEHGSYWARRSEILLVRIGAGSGDGSVDILQRTADDLYRKGSLDEAVAAYDKAAAAATGASDARFELSYKAALVLQQQQKYAAAATRFQQLALAMPTHRHAANAHLLAIANTRQASAAAGTWLDSYPELLREHLANWPTAASASTVAFWRGEFEAGRRNWSEAVSAYAQVPSDAEQFTAAVKALGDCWSMRLSELHAGGHAIDEELEQADQGLRNIILDDHGQLPAAWTDAAREAAIGLAAIRLRYGDAEFHETEILLRAAGDGVPEPTDQWRTAANLLLAGLIARQPGREADTREMLQQLGDAAALRLFELFEQLTELMESAVGPARRDTAGLVVEIARRLDAQRSELNPAQRLLVDRGLAMALAATGDAAAASQLFSRLAQEHPDNAAIQEDFAQLLLDGDDENSWRRALDQWRRVAARSRPRTDRWFRAKYSVALAQYKLGDKAGAAKLIRYLQATEDLSKSGLEREFTTLLARCSD